MPTAFGQRGDRLFDAYDAIAIKAQWDYLAGAPLPGARMFPLPPSLRVESCCACLKRAFGSGLGAQVDFAGSRPRGATACSLVSSSARACWRCRRSSKFPHRLAGIPHQFIGHVTAEPRLKLVDHGTVIWEEVRGAVG